MSEPLTASQQIIHSTHTPTPDPPTPASAPAQAPTPFTLTLPTQHSQNAIVSSSNANGTTKPIDSASTPTTTQIGNGLQATPSNAVNGADASTNGTSNQAFDQAALQARIALAQQMAQAGMQQMNQNEQQHAGMPQPQQQQQAGQGQVSGTERKSSGPAPDWSQIANAGVGGMINNVQGATREALMKQLQALQSSHAAATRNRLGSSTGTGQSPPAPSPGMTNHSNPSPGPMQAQLSVDPSTQQSPAPTHQGFRSQSVDMTQGRPGSSNGPPPTQHQSHASPVPPTPSAPTAPGPPTQPPTAVTPAMGLNSPAARPASSMATGPGPGPRPGSNLGEQRRQFLGSLVSFHRQRNLEVPSAIFNGERDGAIKMGDIWIEVVELFMSVLRVGGLKAVSKLQSDAPFWQGFLRARRIPNPLPAPVNLPQHQREGVEQPQELTTDPVQFLTRVYVLWLSGFEQHMQQSKIAVQQRQQGKVSNIRPPPSASASSQGQGQATQNAPSPASTSAPTPTMVSAPTPTPQSAPPMSAPSPLGPNFSEQSSTPAISSTPHPAPQAQAPPQKYPGPSPDTARNQMDHVPSTKAVPPPIKIEDPQSSSAVTSAASPVPPPNGKRKYTKRKSGANAGEISQAVTPAAEMSTERPTTPKAKRYKVEYRPLHLPKTHMAGWDERAVVSTFPKNNIGHPVRSMHELGTVDMEAVIMGLRSRLPRELGYSLTVLSMLSMGYPEENIHGLPLTAVPELYIELLELLTESAFGDDGYDAWVSTAPKKSSMNDMTFGEIEQLGRESDLGFDQRRDATGGQTDVVLTCLNLLRNFSILPENAQTMSHYPELFELLAHLSDGRLCRLPDLDGDNSGSVSHHQPYSLFELARVRRDVVTILSNLGSSIDLRRATDASVQQIVKVLSSFLSSGWTTLATVEPMYGPSSSRDRAPTPHHSVIRAVEAYCKLSWSDSNREVMSKLPADQHVSLFESMIKLLPVQKRHFEQLHSSEEYLGQTECLALSLYSLAFTAPLATRATLRRIPGCTSVITRIIHDLSHSGRDFRSNPFAVLVRRLAEVLGILNGTSGSGTQGDSIGMSFSAGITDDSRAGKRNGGGGNKVVEKGWLAYDEERVMGSMLVRGMDAPAFSELDSLWWAGDQ